MQLSYLTNLIPSGSSNVKNVSFALPNSPTIQWPNITGNTKPTTAATSPFIKSIFG